MKTLIGINTLNAIDQYNYANHVQFFFRLGVMKGLKNAAGEEMEFSFCAPRRMSIDRMRNEAAKIALDAEMDYLMFIDDDVLVGIHAFSQLQRWDKDIIAGVTHIRGYPYHPMIFNFTDEAYKKCHYVTDYKEKADPETGLLKCDAVGFSCVLIKVDLLKKVQPPFFVTSAYQTEDVFFCKRAKEQLPELEVFVDVNVETMHNLGSDFVGPGNVHLWKEFDEKRVENLKDQTEEPHRLDRSPEQIMKILESLNG